LVLIAEIGCNSQFSFLRLPHSLHELLSAVGNPKFRIAVEKQKASAISKRMALAFTDE
jgi:hypothetical protein